MSRCKHNNRVVVTEKGSWFTEHDVDFDAGSVGHNNEPGGYIGTVTVECHNCGQRVKGTRRTLPGWALHALEVGTDPAYYGFAASRPATPEREEDQ